MTVQQLTQVKTPERTTVRQLPMELIRVQRQEVKTAPKTEARLTQGQVPEHKSVQKMEAQQMTVKAKT